jgi:hypothetical protein
MQPDDLTEPVFWEVIPPPYPRRLAKEGDPTPPSQSVDNSYHPLQRTHLDMAAMIIGQPYRQVLEALIIACC